MSTDEHAPQVMEHYCSMGWPSGCPDSYTGGHYCDKKADHESDHVCSCKARKR